MKKRGQEEGAPWDADKIRRQLSDLFYFYLFPDPLRGISSRLPLPGTHGYNSTGLAGQHPRTQDGASGTLSAVAAESWVRLTVDGVEATSVATKPKLTLGTFGNPILDFIGEGGFWYKKMYGLENAKMQVLRDTSTNGVIVKIYKCAENTKITRTFHLLFRPVP